MDYIHFDIVRIFHCSVLLEKWSHLLIVPLHERNITEIRPYIVKVQVTPLRIEAYFLTYESNE